MEEKNRKEKERKNEKYHLKELSLITFGELIHNHFE